MKDPVSKGGVAFAAGAFGPLLASQAAQRGRAGVQPGRRDLDLAILAIAVAAIRDAFERRVDGAELFRFALVQRHR